MSAPIYNEADYKAAGMAGREALAVLASTQRTIREVELVIRELLERNANVIIASGDQQADSEAALPLLAELRDSRLPALDARIAELVAARTALVPVLDDLIGEWEPEA
ncbi:hypothetical protein GC173_08170 [bacterium]|nr:hypothetical protein [bacterium]